jgi:integrase
VIDPQNRSAAPSQIAARKNSADLLSLPDKFPNTLAWWIEQYFRFEVTTSLSSQKIQWRDLALFNDFILREERTTARLAWSPRLSKAFVDSLRSTLTPEGTRRWGDRTANRVLAHLKTFAKWINKIAPFPLGDPMAKIRLQPVGTGLEIERALTPGERRRLLDAADLLTQTGGRSRDRNRYRKAELRPRRSGYRPWRNRAIIYCLIETGMRRAAVSHLLQTDVDYLRKVVTVEEKGGIRHGYQISKEGLEAIGDYLAHERPADAARWNSPFLFLASATVQNTSGSLSVRAINQIWDNVCRLAGVEGKTPHSARHAMGKHIMAKTGNVAAVQRQLGHRNAAYSMQYARISAVELEGVLNDR